MGGECVPRGQTEDKNKKDLEEKKIGAGQNSLSRNEKRIKILRSTVKAPYSIFVHFQPIPQSIRANRGDKGRFIEAVYRIFAME